MSNPRRHFFPWDRPLLPQLVEWLAQGWDRAGPLDLSRTWAVVPTRESGRRLREALAAFAARAGRAVFPPVVYTPEAIVAGDWLGPPRAETALRAATQLETIIAWSAVLQGINLGDFKAVFPVEPPERNFAWSVRLGRQLAQLQATLAEGGWRLKTVARHLAQGPDFGELARWEELGELEQRLDDHLVGLDRCDPQAAKIAAAMAPEAPPEIQRLVVLAVPDPWPIAVRALAALASQVPVTDVVVFAPAEESAGFEPWGRPISDFWKKRWTPIDDFWERVRLEADPASQARAIARLAARYAGSPGSLALGIPDPEIAAPLVAELSGLNLPAFNPAGRPRRSDGFYHLLNALADLQRSDEFSGIEAIARCPEVMAWLQARAGNAFSIARWLAGVDQLRSRHLPADLGAARAHAAGVAGFAEVSMGLSLLAELRKVLRQPPFAAGATAALAMLFAVRRTARASAADARLAESAAAWMALVRQCESAAESNLEVADWWDLALRLFGDQLRPEEKPAGAFELQGWIELLWEDAPHLVIAGMNDGLVPDAIAGDAFLPESLRERLGLKTNATRLSRDAYILHAAACSRRQAGRLDLLVGKNSAAGDPLRPSRLLLLGPEEELPARVQHLFKAPAPAGPPLPWTRAWKLTPPAPVPLPRVSVTALRSWLDCPFRFYLRHVLKMEAVDAAKSEMDQLDFGTLCHAALEAMGREEALSACTEPDPLRKFLLAALDREVRRQFGDQLSLPLVVQLESARQRLSWLAEAQAAEQAAGWRIIAVEKKVTMTIEGLEVVAKVDRIDRHRDSGAVRVLDYKTSDAAVNPAEAHLRLPRQMRELPEWAHVTYDGKERVWCDLQLPLYRHALAAEYPTLADCGYFNLPKASTEARLEWWQPYPRELHSSAMACAAAVCRAIQAGQFWPPHEEEDPERDPYAALFHRGVAASVDGSQLLPLRAL